MKRISRLIRAAEALGSGNALRLACARLAEAGTVGVTIAGKECAVRAGSSDVSVVMSVLESDYAEKLKKRCRGLRIRHVIDAGANIGVTTRLLASVFPEARITAIEPSVENFELLSRNTADLPRIALVRGGLWFEKTMLAIANPDAAAWSFHLAPSGGTNGVPGVTLSELTERDGRESVFVKMDIEGAEKQVLNDLAETVAEKIGAALIEVHDRKEPGCGVAVARFTQRLEMNLSVVGESILTYRTPSSRSFGGPT